LSLAQSILDGGAANSGQCGNVVDHQRAAAMLLMLGRHNSQHGGLGGGEPRSQGRW
jgi:hypothetical protein